MNSELNRTREVVSGAAGKIYKTLTSTVAAAKEVTEVIKPARKAPAKGKTVWSAE